MPAPTITPTASFGLALYVWNLTGTPAYVQFGGLYDGTAPVLMAGGEIEVTSHGSASGVEEKVWDGISRWTAATFKFRMDVTSAAITDPAMAYCRSLIGATRKFKVTLAGITAPFYFNAIIKEISPSDQPVSGVSDLTMVLVPTGVAPSS